MITVANVNLWDKRVGAVAWNEQTQTADFEFDRNFLNGKLDVSPLQMPIAFPRIYSFGNLSRDTFMGLPGLLADSLPDAYGRAMLDRWLNLNNRTTANPIERLCYLADRGMGALEFEPAQHIVERDHEKIEIASLIDVARQVLQQKEKLHANFGDDATKSISTLISVGTSAGGARAKAVIAYNSETGDVRSGQLPAPAGYAHWLIKLDGVTNQALGDPQFYGLIEYAYYLMATDAGITMTESRILEEHGRNHFMTKRFDRIGSDEKLHMQTLCGIAHFDYKLLRAYSYEQLFMVMRGLRLPYDQMKEMYRRMVFNVIARNQDDHTKNTSFLMNRNGEWSLSPAYDISWACNPSGEWTAKHQMSVNNKWDNFTRDDLLACARHSDINKPGEIIDEVKEAVAKWRVTAQNLAIPEKQIEAIGTSFRMDL